ncbi:lipoprotein insertase outer membrane protein LolB [Thalassotalea maritima]|uniref:lipoprotein insertase outer membrane protein LolB n=1 Tax=Thalassotalea maritima TaxID=3242416 RepID=UPI00352709E2
MLLLLLPACTTLYSDSELYQQQSAREQALNGVNDWLIRGKIAFLQTDGKQSANLYWWRQAQRQELKLTTFLGVNVLTLTTQSGLHTLEIDGKTYQHRDLDYLLASISGIDLPVSALTMWLKGMKYTHTDDIQYSDTTELPTRLTSHLNNRHYQVDYQGYTLVNQFRLANKLTIHHDNMRIKLAINTWELF